MSLVQVKFPAPNRILNIGYKSYLSDKDCMCNIPEEDVEWLPATYKVVWKIEKVIEQPMEEIKKVVEEPKKDVKKVVEKEKATVTKWDK